MLVMVRGFETDYLERERKASVLSRAQAVDLGPRNQRSQHPAGHFGHRG
jgi:hypothetical protein